jgi:hypothetical protein
MFGEEAQFLFAQLIRDQGYPAEFQAVPDLRASIKISFIA